MDVDAFLHAMPEVAQEEIARRGVNGISIGDGVNRLAIAGHNQGVAYFFKADQLYNPRKSDEAGYEVFDTIEQCYHIIDRKNISIMPIMMAPKELLAFNRQGECVGGKYKEAYLRWKEGKTQPGMALRKWDVISDSMVASLEAEGIFTVEQFAAYPRERFAARFPQDFIDAHTRAGQWVAGKEIRERAAEQIQQMEKLKEENFALAERLAKLEAATTEKPKRKNKLLEGKRR